MTDLSRLIADLCADLDDVGAMPLSTPVETLSTEVAGQVAVDAHNFHSFRTFHSETDTPTNCGRDGVRNAILDPIGSRVTSSSAKCVESAERVEREAKKLAESTFRLFPLSLDELERVERALGTCERPALDLNRAAPQRSDWWTGPAMAETDRLAAPAGAPLPISPADVRSGVARELHHLAGLGITGPEAEHRAVEIVRAKVGNSPALTERQTNTGRCHACDEPLREADAAIAVLNPGGAPLHMHQGCHDTYRVQRYALVDRIMRSAGYGVETEGEAA